MNTILCNYGYVINKSYILNKIDKIKNELYVNYVIIKKKF